LRGANVCMYALREASQGEPKYLDAARFQAARANSEKAFHSRLERIGFQRSAPQNNYRRVIAAPIPIGEFCFDTVSYIPLGTLTTVDLDFLLALLNSKLIDWYFTIGSTNSKINEYQFNILPCPAFRAPHAGEDDEWDHIAASIGERPTEVESILGSTLDAAPFSPLIERAIIQLSRQIQSVESNRRSVSRSARAHLDSSAQVFQDVIDRLLFRMVGFSDVDVRALSGRLETMS
jgi:hypothetical protein